MKPRTYLSARQVAARYGTHTATVWRWAAKGNIPSPVQHSAGCTRWISEELDTHDARREAERELGTHTRAARRPKVAA